MLCAAVYRMDAHIVMVIVMVIVIVLGVDSPSDQTWFCEGME